MILPISVHQDIGKYVSPYAPYVKRVATNYIVIHHAAWRYAPGSACKAIYEYHRTRWPKYGRIGYHIVLQEELTGHIGMHIVNPLDLQGANVGNRNHECLGICAATDFTNEPPTEKWLNAIAFAVSYCKDFYPTTPVVGHKEIATPAFPTQCPGPYFINKAPYWKNDIIRRLEAMPIFSGERVIGVRPSVNFNQFWGFLSSRKAPVEEIVARRVFEYSAWLDIDPCYIAALWYAEQGSPSHPLGATEVGLATHNPGNLKAKDGFPSAKVKKVAWMAFESWQLGLLFLVWYLKQFYGAKGLNTVEAIADTYAKETATTDLTRYKATIKETMKAIRASTP